MLELKEQANREQFDQVGFILSIDVSWKTSPTVYLEIKDLNVVKLIRF